MSRYIIEFSNNISIYDTKLPKENSLVRTLPFGVIETKGFAAIKNKMQNAGGYTEHKLHPSLKKISNNEIQYSKNYTPRVYEENTVCSIHNKNRSVGIVEAPTGAGKTNIIASLIKKKNLSTIIIVPTSSLVAQTRDRLLDVLDIEHNKIGTISDGKKEFGREILVATWQSLQNKETLKSVSDYGYNIVIGDEVHKASANVLYRIVNSLNAQMKFGFSATVYRTHEEQLEDVYKSFGKKIISIDIEFLYNNGYILKPKIELFATGAEVSIEQGVVYYFRDKLEKNEKMRWVFANKIFKESKYSSIAPKNKTIKQMATSPSSSDFNLLARIAKDDYVEDSRTKNPDEKILFSKQLGLAKAGVDLYSPRVKKIISRSKAFFSKEKENGVVLFNSIEAGRKFKDALEGSGYENIYFINGQTGNSSDTLKNLSSGSIDNYIIVTTTQFLGEGNDIPSLSKVLVGSPVYPPFSSLEKLQQIIGRAMRPDKNNRRKKPTVCIADDVTLGWISNKKTASYLIVDEIVKPTWVNNNKKVILVSGAKRSGKDTFSTYFSDFSKKHNKKVSVIAIAEPIKRIMAKTLDISDSELEEYKNSEKKTIQNNGKYLNILDGNTIVSTLKKTDVVKRFFESFTETIDDIASIDIQQAKDILSVTFGSDGEQKTFREILQHFGFDGARNIIDESLWKKKAVSEIHRSSSELIIISDARLKDEIDYIKNIFKNATTVLIKRDSTISSDSHPTEEIDISDFDDIITNNSNIDDFKNKVYEYIKKEFPSFQKERKKKSFETENLFSDEVYQESEMDFSIQY